MDLKDETFVYCIVCMNVKKGVFTATAVLNKQQKIGVLS